MPLSLCGGKSATSKTLIFHLFQITRKTPDESSVGKFGVWISFVIGKSVIGNSPSQLAKTDKPRFSKLLQTGQIVAKPWPKVANTSRTLAKAGQTAAKLAKQWPPAFLLLRQKTKRTGKNARTCLRLAISIEPQPLKPVGHPLDSRRSPVPHPPTNASSASPTPESTPQGALDAEVDSTRSLFHAE